jgi:hypothetical protein
MFGNGTNLGINLKGKNKMKPWKMYVSKNSVILTYLNRKTNEYIKFLELSDIKAIELYMLTVKGIKLNYHSVSGNCSIIHP